MTTRRGRVAGVVLAAGQGRRFGAVKALAVVDGEVLVERAHRVMLEAGVDDVVVVLGAEADIVRRSTVLESATVVVAERWHEGMAESLRTGLAAARSATADAAVVVLVDQPWIGAAATRRLIAAWTAGAEVAVATYDGQQRNPVVFDRAVWDEVSRAVSGDEGARTWLRAHQDRVEAVDCTDVGDPLDVDVPADLR